MKIIILNIFLFLTLVLNAQVKHPYDDSMFSIQRQSLEKARISKITDSIEENNPDRYMVNYQKNPVRKDNKIVPQLTLAQFARIPILVYNVSYKSGSALSLPLHIDIDTTVLIYAGIKNDSILGFKEYEKKQYQWHPTSKNINQKTSESLIKGMNFLGGFSNDYFFLIYKPKRKERFALAVGFKKSGRINIIAYSADEIIKYDDVGSWVNEIDK